MPKRDFSQVAKAIIGRVTGGSEGTGFIEEITERKKNPHAQALAALGASKGRKTRAKNLTRKRRKEIARKAARARWEK